MTITPEEAVERLCLLQEEVQAVFGHQSEGDCFCKKGGFWKDGKLPGDGTGYRNSGKAIRFIEKATWNALKRIKKKRKRKS